MFPSQQEKDMNQFLSNNIVPYMGFIIQHKKSVI